MFPWHPSVRRLVTPKMEAAGIEPAQDSSGRSQYLNRLTNAAFGGARSFVFAFEWGLYKRRESFTNRATSNLYAIAEVDGAAWKIGLARDPEDRLATLQIGNPRLLVLYAWTPAPCLLERYLHHVLRRERIHGEWFTGRRTLTLANFIASAQEIGGDMTRFGDEPDALDTVYMWTSRIDDLLTDVAA